VINTSLRNDPYIWQQDEQVIEPPHLPLTFILRTDAVPLLSSGDGRWIARVYDTLSETEGLLIFEDSMEVAYLTADEAISTIGYFIREANTLLAACDVTRSEGHARTVDQVRSMWWVEETRKARAILGIEVQS